MNFQDSFFTYVQSGFPLIGIQTIEVDRATSELTRLTMELNQSFHSAVLPENKQWLRERGYKVYIWDVINGWYTLDVQNKKKLIPDTNLKPIRAIDMMKTDKMGAGVYIMQNAHLFFQPTGDYPVMLQGFREAYAHGRPNNKHLIVVGNYDEIPPEIRPLFVTLDFRLPDRKELSTFIKRYATDPEQGLGFKIKDKDIDEAADASVGMTLHEVESAVCVSLVESEGKSIDRNVIFAEKAKSVRRSGLLEHIETNITMNEVGGLEYVKAWSSLTAKAFVEHEEAIRYGLPTPKGCLMVGISGTGKTHASKAVASSFRVPLFRFDVGRVFASLVGETEKRTREVFKLAESLAPCVILIDEIEKAIGGESLDSGVTSRFVSSLLYWMQEKKEPVYVVATANDVGKLPPELLRKGRFDELWFVDLPNAVERAEILNIHLNLVKRKPSAFKKLNDVVKATEGCTGAEIESIVKQAMFLAFSSNREFTGEDLLSIAKSIVPLSKTKADEINALRKWASERCRPASASSKEDQKSGGTPRASLTLLNNLRAQAEKVDY